MGAAKESGGGKGEWRGMNENLEAVLKSGQTVTVAQEKSGSGNVIKWDMGPAGMGEMCRIRFPYL